MAIRAGIPPSDHTPAKSGTSQQPGTGPVLACSFHLAAWLTTPRFLRWVVFPHLVFFLVAWFDDAPTLIGVLTSVDVALSGAVCITFLTSALDALFEDWLADKAVFLTLCTFRRWAGNSLWSGWC